MTRFQVIISIVVLLLVNLSKTVRITNTNEVLHEINERILAAIDDLFNSLKYNKFVARSNIVEEYTSVHSFIQAALCQNHESYQEIHNVIKTIISNETADQIASVNDVLDEMIMEYIVKNNGSTRNNTETYTVRRDRLSDFIDPAELLKLKINRLFSNNGTVQDWNNSSQLQSRRIFAGARTAISRYPFLASVHVADRFVCAGSLMQENLALTAASCLIHTKDDPSAQVQIRIGSDYVTKMGSIVTVDDLIYHPEFDRTTLVNNLAFLKTKQALRLAQKKVVAIKYDKYDSNFLRNGKDIVILGWGRRSASDTESMDQRPLARAHLDVYDLEDCKYIYTSDYVGFTNFCAGFVDRGDGACNHDGGGPAVAGNLLVGVISFGSPSCGRADAPTVFTRLGLYGDWIESVLDQAKLSQGPEAPLTFEVPSSIEFGVKNSGETLIEDTEEENPRDTLKREFGLGLILQGPISEAKNVYQPSEKFKQLHPAVDLMKLQKPDSLQNTAKKPLDENLVKVDLQNSPEDTESYSDENVKKEQQQNNPEVIVSLSDVNLNKLQQQDHLENKNYSSLEDSLSKKLQQNFFDNSLPDEYPDEQYKDTKKDTEKNPTVVEYEYVEDKCKTQSEGGTYTDLMGEACASTRLTSDSHIETTTQNAAEQFLDSDECSECDNLTDVDAIEPETTIKQAVINIEIGKDPKPIARNDLPATKLFSPIAKQDKKYESESSQSEMEFGAEPSMGQNQDEEKKENKAVIVVGESGTTHRIEVNKNHQLYQKVVDAVRMFAKNMQNNSLRSKPGESYTLIHLF